MTNRDIARTFNLLGNIMELHDENPFKIKSYTSAYVTLRKIAEPLIELDAPTLQGIPGVGKAIAEKILELKDTGKLQLLEKFKAITPEGIQEMLGIRGLGPKKIKVIWKDLEVDNVGDLLYACNENRLVSLKGFGEKTQADIKKKIEYFFASKGKYHYGFVENEAKSLLQKIKSKYPSLLIDLVGGIARQNPIVDGIELLTTDDAFIADEGFGFEVDEDSSKLMYLGIPVITYDVDADQYGIAQLERNSSKEFFNALTIENSSFRKEEEYFTSLNLIFIPPYLREKSTTSAYAQADIEKIIKVEDIKGVVHNHTTYSDGLHTLEQMTNACISLGYQYFVVSDHSQSAFYAQGLKEEYVEMQWREIEELNKKYPNFKIFKSIESDILSDGRLDYKDDMLAGFDLVIASIHSNLNMDIEKATTRLITAIENPYTRILGHPTGRLLLGRTGYPIDFTKVIDACAANGVVIELNANPQRLDLDWQHVEQAYNKGVMISINPDAHSTDQIEYIKYGVAVAQKAALPKEMCLNAMDLGLFQQWVDK
jgi:DNA polymerase (family 10)